MEISTENSKKLADELFSKITESGLYAMSKTDFYDYVLYLFDKYSEHHFLADNSNFENACLLKISESRIKSLKLNIDLKFREKTENDCVAVITRFFSRLTSSNFISDEKRGVYIFVIDDKYTRMCIESVLKKSGTTLNHSFNSERVQLEKNELHALLENYAKEVDANLENREASDKVKSLCLTAVEEFVPAGKLLLQILEIAKKAVL